VQHRRRSDLCQGRRYFRPDDPARFGIEGDVWVCDGLQDESRPVSFRRTRQRRFTQVAQVNTARRRGIRDGSAGQSYPAVYIAGSVGDVWGTYRSDDVGGYLQRIDDSASISSGGCTA